MNAVICGLDEVGRGAFAGPLVAAACICPPELLSRMYASKLPLRDSKKLTKTQREKIFTLVRILGIRYKVVSVSPNHINKSGIQQANILAFKRLIRAMDAGIYIVDGNMRIAMGNCPGKIISLVKADDRVEQVMLASIIAKVHRDRYMSRLHNSFPEYGFDNNAGYGTKVHCEALRHIGPCIHHRTIFISRYVSGYTAGSGKIRTPILHQSAHRL